MNLAPGRVPQILQKRKLCAVTEVFDTERHSGRSKSERQQTGPGWHHHQIHRRRSAQEFDVNEFADGRFVESIAAATIAPSWSGGLRHLCAVAASKTRLTGRTPPHAKRVRGASGRHGVKDIVDTSALRTSLTDDASWVHAYTQLSDVGAKVKHSLCSTDLGL